MFGREEVVGNLVVTDLKKYLEKPPITIKPDEENNATGNADGMKDVDKAAVKPVTYDFNRVRQSVVDAYQGWMIYY